MATGDIDTGLKRSMEDGGNSTSASPESSSSRTMSDLLLCTICYDQYDQPRILPCLHSFCQACLQTYINFHRTQYQQLIRRNPLNQTIAPHFPCPTCRENVSIPTEGIEGFRRDFRASQLKDLLHSYTFRERVNPNECTACKCELPLKEMLSYCLDCRLYLCSTCGAEHCAYSKHRLQPSGEVPAAESPCILHSQESLQYYCTQCNTTACKVCTSTIHTLHKTIHIDEYYENAKTNVDNKNRELKKQSAILSTAHQQLMSKESDLRDAKINCVERINTRAQHVISNIEEQQRNLVEQTEKLYVEEEVKIVKSRNEVEALLSTMNSMSDIIDSIEKNSETKAGVVEKFVDIERRMSNIMDNIATQTLALSNVAEVVGGVDINFNPFKKVGKLGKVNKSPLENAASATKSGSGTKTSTSTPTSRTSRHLPSIHGRPQRLNNRRASSQPVLGGSPSRDTITTRPNVNLPAGLVTTTSDRMLIFGKTCSQPSDNLDTPRDLCIIENHVIVADTGNDRLQVFTLEGDFIKTLCQGQLKPWSICSTLDGDIAVADTMDRCIKIITMDGAVASKFGTFLCPCGIAVDQQGKFYTTDFFSSSVYVLNRQGIKIHQFEFRGQRPSMHSSGPAQIAVSRNGYVVVADTSNKQLGVFTKYGNVLSTVKHGANLGTPQGVYIDKYDRVWLLDSAKYCVNVYSLTGHSRGLIVKLVTPSLTGARTTERDTLSTPLGLTATPDGSVYISDIKQGNIIKYNTK